MGYQNPIIPGFHPDPSFCRVGEDYYLVTSSFEYFPGVPIYHSRDLVHWEQLGHVLTRDSQLPLQGVKRSQGIYAPTIRYHNGLFYMITTNVGSIGNFIVHAADPAGPWSEPVPVDQMGIDPSLFFDEDGKVYYTGTHRNKGDIQGIGMFEIDPLTGRRLSDTRIIWYGTGGKCPEAPHLYKINGMYYLMIAEGGTEYGHMVTIARSAAPYGPYEACPHNPILTHAANGRGGDIAGTGHGDLLQAHDGSWWMTFLAFRPSEMYFHHLGRETFLCPVRWEDGWPIVHEHRSISLEMDVPCLPPVTFGKPPARETFADGLGPHWNWLRNPVRTSYGLSDHGLTLTGTDVTLDMDENPTWLGRRQEQFDMRCQTLVKPLSLPEEGRAGLTVFYDCDHHYDLALLEGRLELRLCVGDIRHTAFSIPWNGPCELEVRSDRLTYQFYYGAPGQEKQLAGTAITRHVSTEATRLSFTGVYVALFAEKGAQANFPWFECQQ
ncbi:MAG: glycoside hydrolase family 43 protein [Aristaeellaceae bacterium]